MTIIKKRNLGRMVALAAVLCLITTCMLGGTLAKYASEIEGTTGVVRAAAFELNKTGFESGTMNILGATTDENYATDGVNLYPGQNGSFSYNIDFFSDVDSVATISSGVVGEGAFSNLETSADTVDLYFVVTDSITAPADDTAYESGVKSNQLENKLENTIAKLFDPDAAAAIGNYEANKYIGGDTSTTKTIYVYWKWLDADDDGAKDAADTILGNAIANSNIPTTLKVRTDITVEQASVAHSVE